MPWSHTHFTARAALSLQQELLQQLQPPSFPVAILLLHHFFAFFGEHFCGTVLCARQPLIQVNFALSPASPCCSSLELQQQQ